MADEAIITQDTEVKEVKEGTVEAEIIKNQPEVEDIIEEKTETVQETVPLKVFLDLKEDLKELKKEMKESNSSQRSSVEVQGLSELSKKYPDVDSEFMSDLLNSATQEATKKIEEKYSPIIERQENEKKRLAFDKAFDVVYERTLSENPDLPKNIDKEVIKALALTPRFRKTPLSEILTKMYQKEEVGKSTTENDTRTSGDKVEDIVSFDEITPEQRKNIMADETARKKYFNWLDTQPGR